ncbi:DUF2213 domain-containing protein [Methylobacterium tarhaniae]|uniref:DUF2213 domain-containing protein n=1 Tax=Methylobacterium tarhaniae TaxID=1187852 RepID=UPI003D024E75
MHFFDHMSLGAAAEIANTRELSNGNLLVNARAARGGNIQDYLGAEIGRPDLGVVRIYRDADEVFRRESLHTFGHKPVTLDHPAAPVTPSTWRGVARGHVGDEVVRDGEFVRIPMMLADQAAIDEVRAGRRELSVGYTCDLDWTAGTTPDGRPYDARQTRIVVDHVAIVARGRAGPDCRIGDERPADGKTMRALDQLPPPQPEQRKPTPMTDRTIVVDGHSVLVSDAAAIAIGGLQRQNQTLVADNLQLTADLNTARSTHTAAITAKDAEIATAQRTIEAKDGEITALKKQLADAASPAALDAARAARDAVMTVAKRFLGDSYDAAGKTDAQVRREVVAKAMPQEAASMSDAAIDGAFLAVSATAPRDQLRDAIAGGIVPAASGSAMQDKAYDEMTSSYADAWKKRSAA